MINLETIDLEKIEHQLKATVLAPSQFSGCFILSQNTIKGGGSRP